MSSQSHTCILLLYFNLLWHCLIKVCLWYNMSSHSLSFIMDRSSKQFRTIINELKLIFSKLLLCLMSLEKDIKTGTKHLDCRNTNSVLDVSDNIQNKLEILTGFLTSIKRLCKTLNPTCNQESTASQ